MLHTMRWTAEKIAQRIALIEPLVHRRRQMIPPFRYTKLDDPLTPPVGTDVDDSDWETIDYNSYWGEWTTNFLLRTQFDVPLDWESDAPVALYLPLGGAGDFSHPEALAYIDETPYAACDRHHQEILLPAQWRAGRTHRLDLHGWTGLGGWRRGEQTKLFMRPCEVVQLHQPTRDFTVTARVALGIAAGLDDNEPAKGHLLNALDDAFKLLDIREPFDDRFYHSVQVAHAALRSGIEKAGPPLDVNIVAAGHAHIDVAWLWTLGQTRRKAGRTFHTVLRLMEQFPDYHFVQSQPQLYDWVRQDYPELFAAIKQHVAEGRWEPIGDMWVEADCNLSGSESLARQFLLGRSFFNEHFGLDSTSGVLWLPDVFGYAWNLPQLIKEAGMDYFFTIKIGWSQYNRLPYDSFWWQGLDGTRVLTHFSTTPEVGSAHVSTYNARATPEQALGTWYQFQQKEVQQELLMAFGYGDGGGGPTREMLENIREMQAFPATPRMRQSNVGEFFRNLERQSGDKLPTWNGELYLELHRGTYTTQSRIKRANRKSEFLLHDVEFLATLASLIDANYEYPTETVREAWQLACLNQFHDIIPGSSINEVYVESLQQYARIRELAVSARDAALTAIAGKLPGDVLVINPTSMTRSDLAFWPGHLDGGQYLQRGADQPVLTQATDNGTWIALDNHAPFGVTALSIAQGNGPNTNNTGLSASSHVLENNYVRVELNTAGDITRIYDKTQQREVLPAGAVANRFQAFEDRPMNWDAWDIDIFYDDKMWTADPASSVEVVESGPLHATLEIKRRILGSDYVQRISLDYNSPRIDFSTIIDWRERHILLKVAFPVDILSPHATYEIQWGNTQRPVHRNTSWDWARFETCAQKWVDLSEGNYGVSLLNDCKYGHDIRDNVMRISLLRSPTMPDPEADQGEHRFAYSLFPHAGSWGVSTVREAYALNDPLIVFRRTFPSVPESTDAAASRLAASLFLLDRSNVVIETVKQAEDGNGIIVRLYECQRQRGPVTLTAGFDIAQATRVNILEQPKEQLQPHGNRVTFDVKPYQIVTLRLVPA